MSPIERSARACGGLLIACFEDELGPFRVTFVQVNG
jgi:hypothetical protein